MTRYLIVGASGMLGRDLADVARQLECDITVLDRAALDIVDSGACFDAVAGHDVVLNAAGYTRVDDAETDESTAMAVNAVGAENLARASARHGALLVQYSTDYVFAGDATSPYDESAPLSPASAYGRSKAEGERRARAAHPDGTIIVRTAWLYGEHGKNFVRTVMQRYADGAPLSVVNDQWGQPTWSRDLAHQTFRMIATGLRAGVLHGTAAGSTTWFGLAQAVVQNLGGDPTFVKPIDSAHFARPAPRPAYSVLGHDGWARIGLTPLRSWRAALDDAMAAGVFR